jgi:UDP-3-O-[3-hydroxymyristoyl] glucosamine N-acyltransferase
LEISLEELARMLGVRFVGDGTIRLTGVAGIEEAREGELTFVANPRYRSKLKHTRASAAIVPPDVERSHIALLISPTPYLTFAKALELFHPPEPQPPGVSELAWIDPSAQVAESATIHPFVFVGKGSVIGARTVLYPFATIGAHVRVGQDCRIHAHVSVRDRCILGDRVILHDGVVIGADGFGYARDGTRHVKIPQVGIVRIEDDVEIGAHTCVDRATMGETRIGRGTKIDNLVQIAHNVRVGEDVILVSQVGISGSTVIGDRTALGGQVGVVGHVRIGNDVQIGAKSGVHGSIPDGEVVSGIPTMPYGHFLKTMAAFRRLPQLRDRILRVEKELAALKACLGIEKPERPQEGSPCGDERPRGAEKDELPQEDEEP